MPGIFLAAALISGISQAPASPQWELRADPAYCRLEAKLPGQFPTFLLDTVPGSDNYRLVIANADIKGTGSLAPASITFSPSQDVLHGLATAAKLANWTPMIRMEGLPPAVLDHIAGAGSVTITTKSKLGGTSAISGAAKAIAAFRTCNAEQLIEWGADAAQFAAGGHTPTALKDRDSWIPDQDFVALARNSAKKSIDVVFRVSVSPSGAVEDCRAVTENVAEGVAKIACAAVMNKPLFTPAKSARGTPVRGAATFRVRIMSRPS